MKTVEFKIMGDDVKRFEDFIEYEEIEVKSHVIDPGGDGIDYYVITAFNPRISKLLKHMLIANMKFEMIVR